eukprot:9337780-Pyramimonas_sp.AAC.1
MPSSLLPSLPLPLPSAWQQSRHTPHAFRNPIGSSTEGPSGDVRMQFLTDFGTPLTHYVPT